MILIHNGPTSTQLSVNKTSVEAALMNDQLCLIQNKIATNHLYLIFMLPEKASTFILNLFLKNNFKF